MDEIKKVKRTVAKAMDGVHRTRIGLVAAGLVVDKIGISSLGE